MSELEVLKNRKVDAGVALRQINRELNQAIAMEARVIADRLRGECRDRIVAATSAERQAATAYDDAKRSAGELGLKL